jgi:hypothetical protein
MGEVIDTCMKQRVVIEFLTTKEVSPIEIYRSLNNMYVIDVSIVRCWVRHFNRAQRSETIPEAASLQWQ